MRFIVYGVPAPWTVPKHGHQNGRNYTYPAGKEMGEWKEKVAIQARFEANSRQGWKCTDNACRLGFTFYLPRPKSVKKDKVYHDRKPDLCNLIKSTEDALAGILFTNDSRVCCYDEPFKYYCADGEKPRCEIEITEL